MATRTIRLSQTLSPFGVGAIYDYRGESLIACDISRWGGRGERIRSERLELALGVEQLKTAPSQTTLWGTAPPLPYFRFPQWLFCPRCRKMVRWSTTDEEAALSRPVQSDTSEPSLSRCALSWCARTGI